MVVCLTHAVIVHSPVTVLALNELLALTDAAVWETLGMVVETAGKLALARPGTHKLRLS